MTHSAFEGAGSAPGLEIWTIKQFEPVVLDSKNYGTFYNGDCYIVLKTSQNGSSLIYDIHFWIGSNSTPDKQGAAVIWTTKLDDYMLSRRAVHHRETQGYESVKFMRYFKPAIRYVEGGNESGFNKVKTNAGAEKQLLKLTGYEIMRIEKVPAEASSLSNDHCFILEVNHDIFVLIPKIAKATHRRNILSIANCLRDDYHNGRATIEIIDEFSSHADYEIFLNALESEFKNDLVSDDSTLVRENKKDVYLCKVLDENELDFQPISKPYKQDKLSPTEIYILDTPNAGVFVWLGSQVSPNKIETYLNIANKYLEIKRPGYIQVSVTRVAENYENLTFKQYFHEWDTPTMDAVRALASDLDVGETDTSIAKWIGKSATARNFMPDDRTGSLTITRFLHGTEYVTENVQQKPFLYQSAVYIVIDRYSDVYGDYYKVVYLWTGQHASFDDKKLAEGKLQLIEEEALDHLTIIKMPAGQECKHFFKLFKGNLAIVFGSGEPVNAKGNYNTTRNRLFRVQGTEIGVDMRAVQIPETPYMLEDDGVYILETDTVDDDNFFDGPYSFVRYGRESTAKEQIAAANFVEILFDDIYIRSNVIVKQGNESYEFWSVFGGECKGRESGWKSKAQRRIYAHTTMTAVTVKPSGQIVYEDLECEYNQEDLSDDGVYIIDTGEEIYLWQGNNIPKRYKTAREDIIQRYLTDDCLERTADNTLVIYMKQGLEPLVFKNYFSSWDNDMWKYQKSYEDLKEEIKASNKRYLNL